LCRGVWHGAVLWGARYHICGTFFARVNADGIRSSDSVFCPRPAPARVRGIYLGPWTGLARTNLKGRDVTRATPSVDAEGCGVGACSACTASTARRGDHTDPQTDDVQGRIIGDGIALGEPVSLWLRACRCRVAGAARADPSRHFGVYGRGGCPTKTWGRVESPGIARREPAAPGP